MFVRECGRRCLAAFGLTYNTWCCIFIYVLYTYMRLRVCEWDRAWVCVGANVCMWKTSNVVYLYMSYISIYVFVCMWVRLCMSVRGCECVYVCVRVHMHVHTCCSFCLCVCVCVCGWVSLCTHKHTTHPLTCHAPPHPTHTHTTSGKSVEYRLIFPHVDESCHN